MAGITYRWYSGSASARSGPGWEGAWWRGGAVAREVPSTDQQMSKVTGQWYNGQGKAQPKLVG